MNFGGVGPANLCHDLGSGYLMDQKVRGGEDCKPVLAGLANKAVGYCDEYPDKPFNPETVKPMLEHRGGGVSARFGGGREDQTTSSRVTASLFGVGNYELKAPSGSIGLEDKIMKIRS